MTLARLDATCRFPCQCHYQVATIFLPTSNTWNDDDKIFPCLQTVVRNKYHQGNLDICMALATANYVPLATVLTDNSKQHQRFNNSTQQQETSNITQQHQHRQQSSAQPRDQVTIQSTNCACNKKKQQKPATTISNNNFS